MDYLPWSSRALLLDVQRPRVPYLARNDRASDIERLGEAELGAKCIGGDLESLASNAQQYLYFGLLKAIFGIDSTMSSLVEEGTVNSQNLKDLLERHLMTLEPDSSRLCEDGPNIVGLLRKVKHVFEKMAIPSFTQLSVTWDRGEQSMGSDHLNAFHVLFSIAILLETMSE